MPNKTKLSEIFPSYCFWDCEMDKLDLAKDAGLIIPRALFGTDEQNFEVKIQKLENLYQKDVILAILRITKENISDKVCELIAKRYGVAIFHRYRRACSSGT